VPDWIEEYDEHPWCNGRVYCNAPARSKSFCEYRPPPRWWIVQLEGAVAPWEYINDTYVLPYWRTQVGKDPLSVWEKRGSPLPSYQLTLAWQPVFMSDPKRFYIVVGLDISRNLINATSWRSGDSQAVINWFAFDDIGLAEQTRTPLWQAGDIVCRIKVGTYDRLPAHSCRGDYQGPWP